MDAKGVGGSSLYFLLENVIIAYGKKKTNEKYRLLSYS